MSDDTLIADLIAALEAHHYPLTVAVERAREGLRSDLAAIDTSASPTAIRDARKAALERFRAAVAQEER
jgi:hypothetical protein